MTSLYRSSTERRLAEHLSGAEEPVVEAIDVLLYGVEVEARAIRRRDPQPGHQRLAAMVARADRDALPVQDLRDVVRMDALHVERDDPGPLLRRRAVQLDPGHVAEALERVGDQVVLVLLDRVEPDPVQVVDRRAEPDGFGDRRRPCLELVWEVAPGGLLELHLADHVAAEVERLHRLEQVAAPPEGADAARAAELVRGEREEIAAARLDVNRPVRRRLRGVD